MICQKMVSFCTTSHDPVNSLLYIGVSWYVLSDLLRSFVQLVSIRTCESSVAKQLRECIRIHSWQYNWKANCEFGYLVCLGALQDVHPVILKHLRMSAAQNFRPVRLLAMSKYCWIKDLTQISNTIPIYIYIWFAALKMVSFHSYASLPEGSWKVGCFTNIETSESELSTSGPLQLSKGCGYVGLD